jgi:uncharacterized membrane protein YeaQ/YmgE (transglycosylase-associated protein family)
VLIPGTPWVLTLRRLNVILWLVFACLGGTLAVHAYYREESGRLSGVVLGTLEAVLGLFNSILWIVRKPRV